MKKLSEFTGKVIAGFPGVGKSTFVKSHSDVLDSDSSTFDKSDFPANYIKHIRKTIDSGKTILVSTHDAVRKALVDNGIDFTLVYPDKTLKQSYLKRYKERGSPSAFVDMMNDKWDSFVSGCESQKHCKHIKLKDGQYIADVL